MRDPHEEPDFEEIDEDVDDHEYDDENDAKANAQQQKRRHTGERYGHLACLEERIGIPSQDGDRKYRLKVLISDTPVPFTAYSTEERTVHPDPPKDHLAVYITARFPPEIFKVRVVMAKTATIGDLLMDIPLNPSFKKFADAGIQLLRLTDIGELWDVRPLRDDSSLEGLLDHGVSSTELYLAAILKDPSVFKDESPCSHIRGKRDELTFSSGEDLAAQVSRAEKVGTDHGFSDGYLYSIIAPLWFEDLRKFILGRRGAAEDKTITSRSGMAAAGYAKEQEIERDRELDGFVDLHEGNLSPGVTWLAMPLSPRSAGVGKRRYMAQLVDRITRIRMGYRVRVRRNGETRERTVVFSSLRAFAVAVRIYDLKIDETNEMVMVSEQHKKSAGLSGRVPRINDEVRLTFPPGDEGRVPPPLFGKISDWRHYFLVVFWRAGRVNHLRILLIRRIGHQICKESS